jgi:hypothetical protein
MARNCNSAQVGKIDMNFFRIKNEYTDYLEAIRTKVERRLPNTDLSMLVRNDYELPNAFLYCISEFNNVTRVSEDDYGLHLMVIYQSHNPRTGKVGMQGEIFALAGLYRSSGEALSEFAPEMINETDIDFDGSLKSLTIRIKLFLKNQEDLIVTTLEKEYLIG